MKIERDIGEYGLTMQQIRRARAEEAVMLRRLSRWWDSADGDHGMGVLRIDQWEMRTRGSLRGFSGLGE